MMYGVPQTANSVRLPSPMDTLPYQRRGSEIDSALGIFHRPTVPPSHRPLVNDRRFHRATGHEFLSLPATHAAKPPSHRTSVHLNLCELNTTAAPEQHRSLSRLIYLISNSSARESPCHGHGLTHTLSACCTLQTRSPT